MEVHQGAGDLLAQIRKHGLEQLEALRLVLVERIALAVAAQADDTAQVLHRNQVLAPEMVESV